MKLLFSILAFVFFTSLSYGQSLKKYPIGISGCSLYMLCDPGKFEVSYSPDSSTVFTGECKPDSNSYGLICVKLKEPVASGNIAEDIMLSYMDYLKTAFKIKSSAGYGKGHTMEKNPDVKGIIDYWTDESGDEWYVKAWTDGKFIAFLYVYGKGKIQNSPKHDVFLNGFRFPGM